MTAEARFAARLRTELLKLGYWRGRVPIEILRTAALRVSHRLLETNDERLKKDPSNDR